MIEATEEQEQILKTEYENDKTSIDNYATIVNLDIKLGDKFQSFKEFQTLFNRITKANFVRFSKRDSRSLEAAKRKTTKQINPELEFYQLRYGCFYSIKHRSKGTGKRKRRALSREYEATCPASICLKVTEDGNYLEVYIINNVHNHPVSEEEFQKLLPKTERNKSEYIFKDYLSNNIEIDGEDKYRMVLKKCKLIAQIAAVSDTARLQEIIKNLDDYIYYLKYTMAKEEIENIEDYG
ncbi:hypothetical protein ABEB36_012403 [Hypothenemus hampei]|uniref:ZSWIM3 N-terminal domain-containing protein n=1 Tax=Hypothenemus hampei TaxID=57062 RepID=A0ABD1EB32_HYPHA